MHPSKLIIVLVALAVVAVSAKEDSTFRPGMAPTPAGPQAPGPTVPYAPGMAGARFSKPDTKAKGTEDDKSGKSAANAGKTDDQKDDQKDTTETDQLMAMVRRAVLYSQKDTKSKAGEKSKTDPSEGADGAQDGTNVQQKPPTKRSAKEPSTDKSGDETDANASTLTDTNKDEGSQTTANDQTAGAAKKDPSEGDDQSAKLKARKAIKRDPKEPAQDPTKDAQDDTSKDKKDDKKSKGNSMQRRSKSKASTKGQTGAKGDEDQQIDQQKGQQEDPAAGADTQLTRRAAHKDVKSVKSNGKTKGEDPAQQDGGVPASPANKRSFYRKRAQFRRMAPADGDVDNTDDASANQDAKDTGNKDKTQGHDQTQDMGQTKGKM
ncbi:hypothetical protein BC940DRAFT_352835 [Gongronella butleri]|nr:hypothetical protein BC940DRAFT_352835 [Gongronella butleri]